MIVFYTDTFVLPLPDRHRFPMAKYARLRERLLAAELLPRGSVRVPPAASDDQLRLAHTEDYLHRAINGDLKRKEVMRIGFPWSPELIERSRRSVGATIAAIGSALDFGVGVNLAGGTHHAFADAGEGYCVFNDAVVAARTWQQYGQVERFLIIDLDVHQGNGTAAIVRDDPTIFSFSMHGAKNFPARKMPSDLDIALPDGTGDDVYLHRLGEALDTVFDDALPDLVIYLAGADPYEHDRLGRLTLTKSGLAARDELVFSACRRRGLPVAVAMAGGYAEQVDDIVEIHFETVRQAIGLSG